MIKLDSWQIGSVFYGVLLLCTSIFIMLPYVSFTLEKLEVLKDHNQRIAFIQTDDPEMIQLKMQKTRIDSVLSIVSESISQKNEVHILIAEILGKAKLYQINVFETNTLSTYESETFIVQEFEIESKGTFHNYGRFINSIEQGKHLIGVKSMEFNSDESEFSNEITTIINFQIVQSEGVNTP